jgi:hypothetical protein
MNDVMTPKKEKDEDVHEVFNLKDTKIEPTADQVVEMDLPTRLAHERKSWKERVLSMSSKMENSNPRKIGELQSELYSTNQICLEHCHFLMSTLAKLNKEYRRKSAKKWEGYMTGHDRKLKLTEAGIYIEGELAEEKEKIELLESQIEYFRETNKNIVNMIYGIKYVVKIL